MFSRLLAYGGFVFLGAVLVSVSCLVLAWYWNGEISLSRNTTIEPPAYVSVPEFPIDVRHQYISVCDNQTKFTTTTDERFCGEKPLLDRMRLFQVDLTHNTILFFEHGILRDIFPISYQAPYGKWYQTPTGYFEFGVKRPKFMSSIFPVWMEDAVQLYEDFFIHAIPYYADGTPVSSQFSGGCLRLQNGTAREFYNTVQKGDEVIVYMSLDDIHVREGFASPVNVKEFWVRQRFNTPLKTDWNWYEDKQYNYIQHAGVDLAPRSGIDDMSVYAIATGTLMHIVRNGENDAGLGNALIIAHIIEGQTRYALYGHLSQIMDTLQTGDIVSTGQKIGVVGNTGYGCNYWRVGTDGCDVKKDILSATSSGVIVPDDEPDIHLHLEIKDMPVLTSPVADTCILPSGKQTPCVGYTSHNPTQFGYYDPMLIIFSANVSDVMPQTQ